MYAEIYRVLKPGALFVSYEWVSTSDFNRSDPEHVKIIDEINFGNGLPVSSAATQFTYLPFGDLYLASREWSSVGRNSSMIQAARNLSECVKRGKF